MFMSQRIEYREEKGFPKKTKKKNSFTTELFQILFFGVLIFAFKSSFVGNFTVPTGSMVPNILPGDKIIADMRAYTVRVPFSDKILFEVAKPEVGDIIVFDYPHDRWTNYVKRLVGKPGDVIEITDGFIIRNGEKFKTTPEDEDFLENILVNGGDYEEENSTGLRYTVHRSPRHTNIYIQPMVVKVPEGHYFFVGDNRDRSSDSREWGFVPADHIKGKAKFIYYSSDSDPGWFTIPRRIRWERIGQFLE